MFITQSKKKIWRSSNAYLNKSLVIFNKLIKVELKKDFDQKFINNFMTLWFKSFAIIFLIHLSKNKNQNQKKLIFKNYSTWLDFIESSSHLSERKKLKEIINFKNKDFDFEIKLVKKTKTSVISKIYEYLFYIIYTTLTFINYNFILYDSSLIRKDRLISFFKITNFRLLPIPRYYDRLNISNNETHNIINIKRSLLNQIQQITFNDDDFKYFLKLSIIYMPFQYLKYISNEDQSFLFRNTRKVILENCHYQNTYLHYLFSIQSSKISNVLISQHGAGSGVRNFSTYDYIDNYTMDGFISWYKFDEDKNNISSSIRLSFLNKNSKNLKNIKEKYLYICATSPDFYLESLDWGSLERKYLIDTRKAFLRALPSNKKKDVIFKLHINKSKQYGNIEIIRKIKKFDKNVDLLSINGDNKIFIFESVSSTGFYEMVYLNNFCIIFSLFDMSAYSSKFKKIIDKLIINKIYFSSEKKFAKYLNYIENLNANELILLKNKQNSIIKHIVAKEDIYSLFRKLH